MVTIDPVKERGLLDLLVHSLNVQTCGDFDVVFFNQTRAATPDILRGLAVEPRFPHRSYRIHPRHFFGDHPIWDLYAFHSFLLRRGLVGDFVMSLHAEEFLDPGYVEHALDVLETSGLDILFGNLTRTELDAGSAAPLLEARTAAELDTALGSCGARDGAHWGIRRRGPLLQRTRHNLRTRLRTGLPTRLRPTRAGFRVARHYGLEDLFFMRTEFARKHNWFLDGYSLPFEDIHICHKPGVCELVPDLVQRTRFPAYFDRARSYHVQHRTRYYQLVDPTFTDGMLALDTADPVLLALQEAITAYRSGQLDLAHALRLSRRNPSRTGTQNLNYPYHVRALRGSDRQSPLDPAPMSDFIEGG